MSIETQTENSGFTTEGSEPFPSPYQDNQRTGEFLSWTDTALMSHLHQYSHFLRTQDPMPRARLASERIMLHLMFEIEARG